MRCDIGNLAWDKHRNVAGLNWLMGSQPPLDKWISNGNIYIYIYKKAYDNRLKCFIDIYTCI